MTTNHDYNTPDRGTENWDAPINENFERLDTGVEIRDQDGNRGQYDPKKGAKFLATDTNRVYLGDGSGWQYLTTLGGIEGQIHVGPEEPDGSEGDVWIDTS